MSGRHLIDAYLARLEASLPADIVDELADGLLETYEHHCGLGLGSEAAAEAALADFGTTEEICAAYVALAPGRRMARMLLATGPIFGACWATVLLTTTHIPVLARPVMGAALLCAIALLIRAAFGTYRKGRHAAVFAGGVLVLLDGALILTVMLSVSALTWLTGTAILASSARICFTAGQWSRLVA